ncbi:hypothetical protein HPB50_022867 [Hyalomma asiaticum]|uniref:Uncharacterized protein n=1 Tax=Hyalomma asiaticum TaxID=266040 RepID=A0ACB7T399_HYAAI|nr:hypothetical protein HPB50_022867 [Hyalomma asiaticum]
MASKNLDANNGSPRADESSTEKQHHEDSKQLSVIEQSADAAVPDKAGAAAVDSPAAIPSDTALIPTRTDRSRPRRRSSSERLHEASQQALATSGVERYLNLWLFIGVSCGVAAGMTLRHTLKEPLTKRQASTRPRPGRANIPRTLIFVIYSILLMYVAFPGDMLLRMLQLCVMPLITASIVAAIGGVDLRLAGRLGRRAFTYYMVTTVIAEIEGLALVFLIKPGVNSSVDLARAPPKRVFYLADAIMDIISKCTAANCRYSDREALMPTMLWYACFGWLPLPLLYATEEVELEPEFVVERSQGTNVLGLLVFAVFVGSIIASTGERNRAVHDLVVSITDIMMSFIRIIMWYCPAGVGFLIAYRILATGDLALVLSQLGMYVVTVLTGLALHLFVVLSGLYLLFVRHRFGSFVAAMVTPALMAISTSSATVPVTIATLEDRVGLDPRVVRFMAPVGATVNMDGAALYEAVSAVFLAQLHGIEMDIGRILAVRYVLRMRKGSFLLQGSRRVIEAVFDGRTQRYPP